MERNTCRPRVDRGTGPAKTHLGLSHRLVSRIRGRPRLRCGVLASGTCSRFWLSRSRYCHKNRRTPALTGYRPDHLDESSVREPPGTAYACLLPCMGGRIPDRFWRALGSLLCLSRQPASWDAGDVNLSLADPKSTGPPATAGSSRCDHRGAAVRSSRVGAMGLRRSCVSTPSRPRPSPSGPGAVRLAPSGSRPVDPPKAVRAASAVRFERVRLGRTDPCPTLVPSRPDRVDLMTGASGSPGGWHRHTVVAPVGAVGVI